MSFATLSLSGKIPFAQKRLIMIDTAGSKKKINRLFDDRIVILSYPAGALSSLKLSQMSCNSSGLVGLRKTSSLSFWRKERKDKQEEGILPL